MMRDIYEAAQNVVVWLGPLGPRVEHALKMVQRLATVALDRHYEFPGKLANEDIGEILQIGPVGTQQWLDYAALLLRPWFSRIWVVQETFFAQRLIVFCGPR